jgi:hypothetical protein
MMPPGSLFRGGLAPGLKGSSSGLAKADCGDCEIKPQASKSRHNC